MEQIIHYTHKSDDYHQQPSLHFIEIVCQLSIEREARELDKKGLYPTPINKKEKISTSKAKLQYRQYFNNIEQRDTDTLQRSSVLVPWLLYLIYICQYPTKALRKRLGFNKDIEKEEYFQDNELLVHWFNRLDCTDRPSVMNEKIYSILCSLMTMYSLPKETYKTFYTMLDCEQSYHAKLIVVDTIERCKVALEHIDRDAFLSLLSRYLMDTNLEIRSRLFDLITTNQYNVEEQVLQRLEYGIETNSFILGSQSILSTVIPLISPINISNRLLLKSMNRIKLISDGDHLAKVVAYFMDIGKHIGFKRFNKHLFKLMEYYKSQYPPPPLRILCIILRSLQSLLLLLQCSKHGSGCGGGQDIKIYNCIIMKHIVRMIQSEGHGVHSILPILAKNAPSYYTFLLGPLFQIVPLSLESSTMLTEILRSKVAKQGITQETEQLFLELVQLECGESKILAKYPPPNLSQVIEMIEIMKARGGGISIIPTKETQVILEYCIGEENRVYTMWKTKVRFVDNQLVIVYSKTLFNAFLLSTQLASINTELLPQTHKNQETSFTILPLVHAQWEYLFESNHGGGMYVLLQYYKQLIPVCIQYFFHMTKTCVIMEWRKSRPYAYSFWKMLILIYENNQEPIVNDMYKLINQFIPEPPPDEQYQIQHFNQFLIETLSDMVAISFRVDYNMSSFMNIFSSAAPTTTITTNTASSSTDTTTPSTPSASTTINTSTHDNQQHIVESNIWNIGVLTISDRVSRGQAIDHSGPELINLIKEQLSLLAAATNITAPKIQTTYKVVADDVNGIRAYVSQWASQGFRMIMTTGGTGFSERDVTPEAIKPLLHKKAPGMVIAMINTSLSVTPHAMLSRPVAGMIDSTLVVTFPGSAKAVRENFTALLPALPHALSLLSSYSSASLPESHRSKDYNPSSISNTSSPHQSTNFSSSSSSPSITQSHSGCGGHHHSHGHNVNNQQQQQQQHRSSCGGNHKRGSTFPMIDVDIAIDIILKQCDDVYKNENEKYESKAIMESVGMIVAEDIQSQIDFPPFRASIKDGYAIRSKDGAGEYIIIASSLAGGGDAHKLQPDNNNNDNQKKCIRITTGAMIPDGYDAVVMVEDTELIKSTAEGSKEERVNIEVSVPVGCDIRPIGSDIKKGAVVIKKGEKIGSAEIGLLATLGHTHIKVYGQPRITIISTGDELTQFDTEEKDIKNGHIRDSNSPTLASVVEEVSQNFGRSGTASNVKQYGIVPDRLEDLERALVDSAATSEVIITSGGVSMGQLDLVKPLLGKLGTVHFGRVNMKPGKPLTFATIERDNGKKTLVFALPGNPVSTMVTFYLFVVPALRKLCGHSNHRLPLVQAKLDDRIRMDPERPEYHRCMIKFDMDQHCFIANSTGSQASCRLLSMKRANALLVIPQKEGYLEKGSSLNAIIIGPLV
ncbi:gephyrin [Cavenderia fasciculata]|uniref:Gephyrin n=1 Tax=Cavenderia fasciculata TaxID=261658 RepID=F4QAI9_CACFS|nr:gephyrin [Cavenderia fasciculata]EGG15708.1 gephyrin [Cavenderia fasciculata]|eukprot:XP_004354450.1 gephyrin [Cavenderia fasciculata]